MYIKIKYLFPIVSSIFLFNGCGGSTTNIDSEDSDTITQTFKIEQTDGSVKNSKATLKSSITVDTNYGTKTLLIWVSNDSFGDTCTKSRCITQDMVDKLQTHFLQNGKDNDIYDWVTNVYGEEWGSEAQKIYDGFIGETDEINILFTDIENDDSPNGGAMGYFYAKDNFKTSVYPNSNEKIMFYIDSVMFANEDNNDFWQKETYSTLAHEFQHMIHFYQKRVIKDISDDTWINEMLSETTEDLIATKINHIGPRGVSPDDGSAGYENNTQGRYPVFNSNNYISLTSWDGTLANYSNVNAFGTYLTRNYGGAKVLHDILYSNKAHEDSIEEATNKEFGDLLQEWGEAVILSSIENPEGLPTYNFGDFLNTTYNNIEYNLGSINFFNYNPTPYLYSGSDFNESVNPQSNLYYIVGEDIDNDIDLNISLDSNIKANAIIKYNTNECDIQELYDGENNITIDDTSNVYVVITNTNPNESSSVAIEHDAKYIAHEQKTYKLINISKKIKVPDFVTKFNNNINFKKGK